MNEPAGDTASPALDPGLFLHRSSSMEALADGIGAILATHAGDPFAFEQVCVPHPALQRWLSQRWSTVLGASAGATDGVCAGIEFMSPPALLRRLAGDGAVDDPWRPETAVWTMLDVLDACVGQSWFRLVERHLGSADDVTKPGRRYATARRLVRLFRRYADERPALLTAWSAGVDADAEGQRLPPDAAWQPLLWRAFAAAVPGPSPVVRRHAVCQRLARQGAAELASSVHLVAPPRWPLSSWQLVEAASTTHRIEVWQLVSSPTAVAASPAQHPLNSRLGGSMLAQARLLDAIAAPVATLPRIASSAPTLLTELQASIDSDSTQRPAFVPAEDDHSIVVHSSHGPDRQVEVLRDVVTGLLADDPSLEPRDIVVLCPALPTFAPLLTAAFGLASAGPLSHPGHQLRVQVTHPSVQEANPLLGALRTLLHLAGSRAEAAQLLDVCALPPVAYRFGFDADELERIAELVSASGIKWGIDAGQRAPFGLRGFAQNTWAAGLDRMLLGIALSEHELVTLATALPLDDVDSSDIDLVGRLTELVVRVRSVVASFEGQHRLDDWIERCRRALDLLTATPARDSWQAAHASGVLADLAPAGCGSSTLSLGDLQALVDDALRGRPERAPFGNGSLVVASLAALRYVPHRVVCLLGVDDTVFPRAGHQDGDDLLLRNPAAGDPDPRSDDRHMLLDAVMAARERLVVVHQGADARTNEPVPDAVPLAELIEALDRLAPKAEPSIRDRVRRRHPLQPFSPESFRGPDRSFDHAAWAGAQASLQQDQQPPRVFSPEPLPAQPALTAVSLDELIRFYQHPLRALLRQRGGVFLGQEEDADDDMPIELDGLGRWPIGQRLLDEVLSGHSLDEALHAEWLRGTVPPRQLGTQLLDIVAEDVRDIAGRALATMHHAKAQHDVEVDIGGVRVSGRVRVYEYTLCEATFSWISARHTMASWVRLLALICANPDRPWTVQVHGKRDSLTLSPPGPDAARALLGDLVALYERGLCEPLPLPARTSAEYVRLVRGLWSPTREGADPRKALRDPWTADRDPAWEAFFGGDVLGLFKQPASTADAAPGRPLRESSRFGELALRVWGPVLEAQERV